MVAIRSKISGPEDPAPLKAFRTSPNRRVRGFKHLTPSEREEALPRAAPHIREMHLAAAED